MKTLIAIGGGSFQKQDTTLIDEYAIARCRKPNPHVLFLPTASRDDQGYAKRFKKYYRSLGCEVQALRLLHTKLTDEGIAEMLKAQDMIYLGAGDTRFLMEQLQLRNLDVLLKELVNRGTVLCGISAGANVLFSYGYSEVAKDTYELVEGMGLISGAFCPHYQKAERKSFDTIVLEASIKKIGCDDKKAYVVEEDKEFFL